MKSPLRIISIVLLLILFVATVSAAPVAHEREQQLPAQDDGRDEGATASEPVVEAEASGTVDTPNAAGGDSDIVTRDQVILDDLIVEGSICAGLDCVNGESFGFDTLRLKENNLRIKFQDTSASASFPSNDWQITANDSTNGGANKFSIDDIDGGRTPFTIEASAPSHSLYVDDGGRVGLGTSTPVVELQVVSGDSPTLRLEQDGSSGFTPQTWDVAGNETNFFVRDATNGSRLPFKIRPSAPTNSIYVDTDGDIGLGDASPDAALDLEDGNILVTDGAASIVSDDDTDVGLYIDHNGAGVTTRTLFELENNGPPRFLFENSNTGVSWIFAMNGNNHFQLDTGAGSPELLLLTSGGLRVGPNGSNVFDMDGSGNLALAGTLQVNGVGGCTVGCKTAPKDVDASKVLDNLATVPFTVYETSRVSADENGKDVTYIANHIFPDAIAFNATFGLGTEGSEAIAPVDLASIALVAAQELYAELQAKDAIIAEQQVQIDEQQEQIEDLTTRMAELEALVQELLDE